jgi:hypothetical protein
MLKYSHPLLALILEYWPITIFAPTILLLIATLALITRWWDRRDQEARENLISQAPATGVVVSWHSGRRNPVKAGAPRVDTSSVVTVPAPVRRPDALFR